MLAAVASAAFEHLGEADQVRIDIGRRILQRVTHARLRRQMDDARELPVGEQPRHSRAVGKIEPDETEVRKGRQMRQADGLERDVVIIVEIVEANDIESVPQQAFSDVKTDKPGGADHKELVRTIHRSLIWTPRRIASTSIR